MTRQTLGHDVVMASHLEETLLQTIAQFTQEHRVSAMAMVMATSDLCCTLLVRLGHQQGYSRQHLLDMASAMAAELPDNVRAKLDTMSPPPEGQRGA